MQKTAGSPDGRPPEREHGTAASAARIARARLADLRLPTKLLLITIVFVMLAEILVFVPSIANYRYNWLQSRVAAARLAALAADTSPGGVIPPMVRRDLLISAEVHAVAFKRDDLRRLVLPSDVPLVVDAAYDLRSMRLEGGIDWLGTRLRLIGDALYAFIAPPGRTLAIYGSMEPGGNSKGGDFVEVVLSEAPLRQAMMQHGLNILGLSILISIIAAAAVYLTLIRVLVRPMMRLTNSMLHFSENPEDANRIIAASARSDEIGVAERELAGMQTELNQLLQQRRRLAELGLAVSKINHDLRNMLSSAQLISDRLGELPDPTVQRFAPKLIASLDRAINFCNDTLRFGRAQEAPPRRDVFNLAELVGEVADGLGLPSDAIEWVVKMPPTLQIDADRDHLYRVFNNLVRNAVQAIESAGETGKNRITVRGRREGRRTIIEMSDDGPGVPPKAREHLFKAFKGGTRKGGSGLGLAISAELIRAHGGEIRLMDSDAGAGATFRIELPDRTFAAAS